MFNVKDYAKVTLHAKKLAWIWSSFAHQKLLFKR